MDVTLEQVGDVVVVTLPGEHLDAGNTKAFREAITPVLDTYSKVVFDLRQLRFVDSAGLGAILTCLRQLQTSHGDLKLCGMLKPVRALFDLVRMHRLIEAFDTSHQAIAAFQVAKTPCPKRTQAEDCG